MRLVDSIQRRRTVAVTGAVLLHVLFLLFLLPQTSKGLSAGGSGGLADGGDGQGLTLDLTTFRVAPPLTTAVAEQAQEDFTPIAPETTAVVKTADNALALPDIAAPVLSPPEPSSSDATPAQAKAQPAASAGGAGQGGQTAGIGDDLWAAIAPCWKRIAARDALPVRLTVSFAGNGMLQRAPEIVRDPSAPIDVRTQLSEGEAIQALSECGAYAMAAGRENVTINFPKP
ncbi:MAG: hypothetical protein JF571_03725 [Asticcacaulis sp.]|nr:hypothetical protein [Asticcacaulis sp.]